MASTTANTCKLKSILMSSSLSLFKRFLLNLQSTSATPAPAAAPAPTAAARAAAAPAAAGGEAPAAAPPFSEFDTQ